jgi:curved DNA-binding protein CbpA
MAQSKQLQSFYEVLEVAPGAAQHEIHQAYERAKMTYSPESPALYTMFTENEARELLRLIEEAYSVLGNQLTRQRYDQSLVPLARPHLPDLEVQTAVSESAGAPVVAEAPRIPEGFARTRFGVYEVDLQFEEQIKNQTEFDGAFLKKVRQYKGVNLDQLSTETRIGKAYLASLEAGDADGLPALVFVRGFVVQVARALGLNDQRAANSYMQKLTPK